MHDVLFLFYDLYFCEKTYNNTQIAKSQKESSGGGWGGSELFHGHSHELRLGVDNS
jgi:hypothetical protein